jgi:primary-amine oxidase
VAAAIPAAAANHPLDQLSYQEVWRALEILRDAGRLDAETTFSQLTLSEPDKDAVRAWREGDDMSRAAYALVRQGDDTFEATVDLAAGEVSAWTELTGVQPNWSLGEFGAVVGKVLEHPDFIAGLEKRGITDTSFLDCTTIPPGYFGTEEEKGRRLGHVRCSEARGARNTWARQVEGLTAVVDLTAGEVLRVVDDGVAPIPDVDADYDRTTLDHPREIAGPFELDLPEGVGFDMNGYQVSWQNWSFHLRPDQRTGLVVSLVDYRESPDESPRPVMYQGQLSEIYVPYMDPAFAWYARNFIDAGEFPAGGLAKPLLRGRDCPDHAVYIDSINTNSQGRPRTVPRTTCIYERETGDPSWRHYEDEQPDSRKSRDLVVRTAAVVGNYDYLLDWIFRQDGSIEARVGATGLLEVKATSAVSAIPPTPTAGPVNTTAVDALQAGTAADAYGRFLDRNVIGVNHDHYFSYRLDLDVDGADNRFVADRLVTRELPADHPRRSVWVQEPHAAQTEQDAQLDINLAQPALWRILSSSRRNAVGYPTSYQLMPGRNANHLFVADDYSLRRAGFIDHHLWVTPYDPGERFAAGDHPTLSEPGMGLPAWTEANRSISDEDLVIWHTVGMHHLPRAEDWPVMPVMWHGFELRPFDFFDRNPALDLP